jgi:hypothetical protein
MKAALGTSTPETFPIPPGIQNIVVDNDSGLLPTALSPSTHSDVFASYSVPTTYDNMHVSIPMDSTTGLPATNLTPPAQVFYKTCTIYKSEMPGNPAWEQPVELWASTQPNACPNSYTQTATSSPTTTVTGTAPTINIVDPADGSILFQLPIVVDVSAAGQNPIARVDLSIDGQFAQSKTSAPYTFILNGPFSVGQHVFAAKAVDTTGAEADTSVSITYNPNELTVPTQ